MYKTYVHRGLYTCTFVIIMLVCYSIRQITPNVLISKYTRALWGAHDCCIQNDVLEGCFCFLKAAFRQTISGRAKAPHRVPSARLCGVGPG